MRKFILTFLFCVFSVFSFGQQFNMRPDMNRHFFNHHNIDISQYEVVDSLPLERMFIYSPFDYESDKVISTGSGTYLIELPYKDKMIIRTNKDRTKAIVVYNSVVFGRHKVFDMIETEKRIVLVYEDDDIYCGYAYDKRYKVAKYFEQNDFIAF